MSVWGADNFANDIALDYVHALTDRMIEQVERTVSSPHGMEPDEPESVRLMCNIELLWLIGRHARLSMMESVKVEGWKEKYLAVWDSSIDGLLGPNPKPGVKAMRRAVIEESFDRLIALCKSQGMLEGAWARIHAWLAANAPVVLESLQPPATDEQLRDAEESMGVVLPADVRACYRVHDGQRPVPMLLRDWPDRQDVPRFLYGQQWLSLDRMVEHWRIKKGLLEEGAFGHPGQPRGPIRPDWWHPKWVPLTADRLGYMNCLDLAPAEGGRVGQVIYWCHDDPSRGVVAPELTDWLAQFADALEQGEYTTVPDKYGPSLVSIDELL
jgi:cell wall assembly regulator SMI1